MDEVAEGVGTMVGTVVSISDGAFVADLVDAEGVVEVKGHEFLLGQVPPDDKSKVVPGATFTWRDEDGDVVLDFR